MWKIFLSVYLSLCCLAIAQDECTNPLQGTYSDNENGTHIDTIGIQMLLPDIKFNCTGNISELEGIVYFSSEGAHYCIFQIWRPSITNNIMTYDLVSVEYIQDRHLTSSAELSNFKHFRLFPENLHVQKDDIVGFYVPKRASGLIPFLPTFLANSTAGGSIYYTESDHSICKVALCNSAMTEIQELQLQMKMKINHVMSPTQTNTLDDGECIDPIPRIDTCGSIISTTEISHPSLTSVLLTSSTGSPTPSNTGDIPLPVMIGVPVSLTVLLILFTSILIISVLCMKFGKPACRRNTEKVHSAILTRYQSDNGTEYTQVDMTGRRKSQPDTIIDETDFPITPLAESTILSPAPSSPAMDYIPDQIISPTIMPYASLTSLSYERERRATISGPVSHAAPDMFSSHPSLHQRERLDSNHSRLSRLPVVGEDVEGFTNQEPTPYLNPLGSLGNLPSRTSKDFRPLNDRKLSHPSKFPGETSVHRQQQPTQFESHSRPRFISVSTVLDQSNNTSSNVRKISQPAGNLPCHSTLPNNRQQKPIPPSIRRLQSLDKSLSFTPVEGSLTHNIETSQSLNSRPNNLQIASDREVSPYLEPSPSNTRKFPKPHRRVEKSITQDVIDIQPYMEPSPTVPRKLSEGNRLINSLPIASPYMEPAVTNEDRGDLVNSMDTFNYIPPEVVSRNKIMDDNFCVPNSIIRQQLNLEQPSCEVYSRLDRSDRDHSVSDSRQDGLWTPSNTEAEIYNELSIHKYREICREQIFISECLGSGHFGTVSKGLWEFQTSKIPIAVKILKPGLPDEDRIKFLQEAAITGQFHHPNVIKLHGVVTIGTPLMIVLELLPKGDLKGYLKIQKKNIRDENANQSLLSRQFLAFARQISWGMEYLSSKGFIHRDLAARNVFLTNTLTCKIGDFGMARDLAQEDVYSSQTKIIPLKWTAPEAIGYRKYTTASDVWSYGMVLYEIYSLGRKPLQTFENKDILVLLQSGYCQPPPPGCPRKMYQLMVDCWNRNPSHRPTFSNIVSYLSIPDDVLMHWNNKDQTLSDGVALLGSPLHEANYLYRDLQTIYHHN